jgi:hypothetical protein
MPEYTRTIDATVVLPDIGLVVEPGTTVTIPDGFWADEQQAVDSGFSPVTQAKATSTPAPLVEES